MIGDFFTKPLQGSLFRKFRDIILNTTSDNDDNNGNNSNDNSRSVLDVLAGTSRKEGQTAPSQPHVSWADIVKNEGKNDNGHSV